MKKVYLFLCVVLISMFFTSCSDDNNPIYDEFAQKYYELNPDGHDPEPGWYEYKSIITNYFFEGWGRTSTKKEFYGYIDFEKDSFEGIVTTYRIETATTSINYYDEIEKMTYCLLKDEKYWEVEETKFKNESDNTLVTRGCSNITKFNLDIDFDNDVFLVNEYNHMVKTNSTYESINICNSRVIINRAVPIDLPGYGSHTDGVIYTKTIYQFDDYYKIVWILQYKNITYYEHNIAVLAGHYSNSSTVSGLKRYSKYSGQEIEIPTTYDEEFILDEANSRLHLE